MNHFDFLRISVVAQPVDWLVPAAADFRFRGTAPKFFVTMTHVLAAIAKSGLKYINLRVGAQCSTHTTINKLS